MFIHRSRNRVGTALFVMEDIVTPFSKLSFFSEIINNFNSSSFELTLKVQYCFEEDAEDGKTIVEDDSECLY